MTNYYVVLGVPPIADPEEIRDAYLALMRRDHPDIGGTEDRARELNEAYSTLRDPVRRSRFDAQLRLETVPCPSCKGQGVRFVTVSFTQKRRETCVRCAGAGFGERT